MAFRKLVSLFVPPILRRIKVSADRFIFNKGGFGIHALDIEVIKLIKPSTSGFFVELGANDGLRQSNSYILQRNFSWGGLLIEPNPARFEECVINRSFSGNVHFCCAACVPFAFDQSSIKLCNSDLMSVAFNLDVSNEDAMSHSKLGSQFLKNPALSYTFFASARTLTDILDDAMAPPKIDFLSLDVEGNELSVLQGLDFEKYSADWILVESRDDSIAEFLCPLGYSLYHTFDHNSRRDQLFKLDLACQF